MLNKFLLSLLFLTLQGCNNYAEVTTKETICPIIPEGSSGGIKTLPGCFDYYVFSQFWLNELCISDGRDMETGVDEPSADSCEILYQTTNSNALAPHGLWPNLKNSSAYPEFCTDAPFDVGKISEDLRHKLGLLYTDITPNLESHEWRKHGTCSNKTQQDYFNTIVALNSQQKIQSFIKNNVGRDVAYQDLKAAFGDVNHSEFICAKYSFDDKQYLMQTYQYFDKQINPINLNVPKIKNACEQNKPIHIRKPSKFLTMDDFKKALGSSSKLTVGFDIDDTVLFSTPPFYYGVNKYGSELPNEFWQQMNTVLDAFSLPKKIARDLLSFHQSRKDKIYFITARPKTEVETLTQRLIKTFSLSKETANVIFTGDDDKTQEIKAKGIQYYYGDADTDITSALRASAIPVRVKRNAISDAESNSNPGYFGELVLIDSEY
ncbi:hypothetical protein BGC33_08550 [Bathymodiolus thermophilus thioautotrophic gill symbiont]|uniref:Class B acid phosphatase n=2 Tax=Bathymodiolus thermophilus thioautotrophic gill symbiont TaxID=2360 RepID=A0A1J5U518_9GAMM|nr:hypothetical protein BGC33_08550 [Bathymodiolus thermophilus thioautotrophic gill symbiont]